MTKLIVNTRWLEQTPDLANHPDGDLVFIRQGKYLVGYGQALKISATGENRITKLSEAWKEITQAASVNDDVQLPGSGLLAFASITFSPDSQYQSCLIVPQKLIVVRGEQAWITEVESETAQLKKSAESPTGEFGVGTQHPKAFLSAVNQAIEKITNHDLEKVVLARDLVLPISKTPNLEPALKKLHSRYPHCWTYLIADNFGASPELLIRSAAGEVSARVLAGTAARGTDPDVDRAISEGLLHSSKNQHEHEFAVRSLVQKLEPFCDLVSADEKPFSLALPDLFHLATDVTGTLKEKSSLLDVVAELHPTAAVAGTPREKAMQLIAELEDFDRGGYAGPIGWVSADGSGELAIALRGGRVEPNQIRAFAGCGIVAESDPQAELDETELKFKAVRWAFQS